VCFSSRKRRKIILFRYPLTLALSLSIGERGLKAKTRSPLLPFAQILIKIT
jgi:hypothetical protein